MDAVKKANKSLTTKLTESERNVKVLTDEVNKLKDSSNEQKKVSGNLKYLINVDRNVRRYNVILFGIKENGVLQIEEQTAATDLEKCHLIFEYIGSPRQHLSISDLFRLGKENQAKSRPIKIIFSTKEMASSILTKSAKLKQLATDGKCLRKTRQIER